MAAGIALAQAAVSLATSTFDLGVKIHTLVHDSQCINQVFAYVKIKSPLVQRADAPVELVAMQCDPRVDTDDKDRTQSIHQIEHSVYQITAQSVYDKHKLTDCTRYAPAIQVTRTMPPPQTDWNLHLVVGYTVGKSGECDKVHFVELPFGIIKYKTFKSNRDALYRARIIQQVQQMPLTMQQVPSSTAGEDQKGSSVTEKKDSIIDVIKNNDIVKQMKACTESVSPQILGCKVKNNQDLHAKVQTLLYEVVINPILVVYSTTNNDRHVIEVNFPPGEPEWQIW